MKFIFLCKPEFLLCGPLQYSSKGGLPSRSLETNICAVCGQELVLRNEDDDDDNGPEKTYKLSCGHLYPYCTLSNALQKVLGAFNFREIFE